MSVTIAERATKRRRACSCCEQDAVGFVTVSVRNGERASGPVCESGPCRRTLVDELVASVTGWPNGIDQAIAEPVPERAVPPPQTADAAAMDSVDTWWDSLNLATVEWAARRHLDACAEQARLAPDGHQAASWAAQRVASVLGLAGDMPEDPAERTQWLLRWDRAEDWAAAVARRWLEADGIDSTPQIDTAEQSKPNRTRGLVR